MLASTVCLALCRASGWSRRENTIVSAATPVCCVPGALGIRNRDKVSAIVDHTAGAENKYTNLSM